MVASVASVALVAQAAIPSSLYVGPGSNRRFFLGRLCQGSPSGLVAPTLGGQAADQTRAVTGGGMRMDTWIWTETELAAAGITVAGGNAATAAFTDGGGTSELMWCYGTVKNTDQTVTVSTAGRLTAAASQLDVPAIGSGDLAYRDGYTPYFLQLAMLEPATATISEMDDSLRVTDKVLQTSYVAYLLESPQLGKARYIHTLDGASGDILSVLLQFPETSFQASADKGKDIPTRRPASRSIDAKTIADRYNMGAPTQEDYNFPGGRKFYQ